MNVGVKLAGLVDDREAVNEEKKSVQHVSLYRIGQEFVRQWYVVIEEVCSAEHMHRMGDTRLCSPSPPLSAACSLPQLLRGFRSFHGFLVPSSKVEEKNRKHAFSSPSADRKLS